MNRDENIKEFNDTMSKCRTDPDLIKSIKDSVSEQRIIYEDAPLNDIRRRFDRTQVSVTKGRSLQVARGKDGRVCILNFASFRRPGGGVANGSTAQEESICRITTLYPCLSDERMLKGFYEKHRDVSSHLYNSDIIYTPGIKVIKMDLANPISMPKQSWYGVDIISCAAPNQKEGKIPLDKLRALLVSRIERIFNIAMSNDADVLILGAFGCGVFENDPTTVAEAFQKVLDDYEGCFREVLFPIFSQKGDENYRAFEKVIRTNQ